jgi:hypothetical protein
MLSPNHTDLSSMDKSEVSKSLFGLIQWEDILRSGVILAHRDVSLVIMIINNDIDNSSIDHTVKNYKLCS